jgi:hypothetical protein
MSETLSIETEKKVAMDYAFRLAAGVEISCTDARRLAARANLVSVLYRAMMGYEIATPEVVEALIKGDVPK